MNKQGKVAIIGYGYLGSSQCFRAIATVCPYKRIISGGGPSSVEIPEFNWINSALGNIKNALHGTYHAVGSRHLGRYLGAFVRCFNRRFQLDRLVNRLP